VTWGNYLAAQASARQTRKPSLPARSEKSLGTSTTPPLRGLHSRGKAPAKRRRYNPGNPITMRQYVARKSMPTVSDGSSSTESNTKRFSTTSTKRGRLSPRPTSTSPSIAREAFDQHTHLTSNAAPLGMEEDDDMLFDLEALARDRNPVVFPKPPSVKLSSTPTTNGQENAASAQENDSAAKDV
jgi:hypothetical protein